METIIKISNLSKRFNETVALITALYYRKRRGFRISGTFWRWQTTTIKLLSGRCTVIMVKLKYWANHPSMTQ